MKRWTGARPESLAGRVVGDGHCVAFVREATGAPHTSRWRRGAKVRDGDVAAGTAIATFDPSGRYGNHTDGRSHAAVLHDVREHGILVWDQWRGQAVQQRIIRFRAGSGPAVNNGDQYYCVETEVPHKPLRAS